jgi:hypothetical protein
MDGYSWRNGRWEAKSESERAEGSRGRVQGQGKQQ